MICSKIRYIARFFTINYSGTSIRTGDVISESDFGYLNRCGMKLCLIKLNHLEPMYINYTIIRNVKKVRRKGRE